MYFLKTITGKWWFWVIIGLLIFCAWWYRGVIMWEWHNMVQRAQNISLQMAYNAYERENNKLLEAYKNDTYGGVTPEETMDLLVSALQRGDYELASKYYLPEKQKEALEDLKGAVYMDEYLQIITEYDSEGDMYPNGKTYEINYYSAGQQVHFERLILNEYTNVWKIEDL